MRNFLFGFLFIGFVACSKSGNDDPVLPPSSPTPPEETKNTAPGIPILGYPEDSQLCVEDPIGFQWSSVTDPDGDPISYKIEIATDETFATLLETATTTQNSVSLSLEAGLQFNWRVRAFDTNGNESPFSDSWQFITETPGVQNHLPFSPELVSPDLYTLVSGPTVVLEWNTSDVDGDILEYEIFFGTSNPPNQVEAGILEKSLEVVIQPGNTYYWQIIARDSKGGVAIGQTWNFKS